MKRLLLASLLLSVAVGESLSLSAQGPPVGPQGRGVGQGRELGRGPVRDARERPVGTAVIRGRILATETGTPIRRAQVRARSGGGRGQLASTDADGRFEFRDLPAGRWNLTASKASFVTLSYGQRRPFEAGRPIELADGEVVERADFYLPRGAVITGQLFDEFGDPVAGARIRVLRYRLVQGTRRLMPTGSNAQSDDRGMFRAYGLMPGDYYVAATLRALPVDDPGEAINYAPTYFPGTGSVLEAQRISVGLGQEHSGINFALLPVRTVRLTGVAIDSNGIPLSTGTVVLSLADQTAGPVGQVGGGTRIRAGGRFTIPNVAPGSYTLTVVAGRPRDPDAEFASMTLTVANEDLSGITVVTGQGATLSGTVAVAPDATGTLAPTRLQVTVRPLGLGRNIPPRPGRATEDGTFQVTNLFGRGLIRVNGLPRDWTLKAVTVAGTDITDAPIEFGANQDIRDAQIVVTNRLSQVTGRVTTADGPCRARLHRRRVS